MQSSKIHFIVFDRDGRFEAEGINAAVAGTGPSALEAVAALYSMAKSMAALATRHGTAMTAAPDAQDKSLFDRLVAGKVAPRELHKLGIAAFGGFELSAQKPKRAGRADAGTGKLELELVA